MNSFSLTFISQRDLLLFVKFDSVLFANVFNNIGLTAFEFPRSLPRLYHVTVLKHGLKALDTSFGHCFGHATTSANSLVSIIVLSTLDNMRDSLLLNFSSSEMIYCILFSFRIRLSK